MSPEAVYREKEHEQKQAEYAKDTEFHSAEKEADHLADRLFSSQENGWAALGGEEAPQFSARPVFAGGPISGSLGIVQRKENDSQDPPPSGGGDLGGGNSGGDINRRFGGLLGADLSGVRFHTDHYAGSLAEKMDARAFTRGRDIYFGQGEYRPETHDGQRLIAHELVHTIQQGAARQSLPGAFPVTQSAPSSVALCKRPSKKRKGANILQKVTDKVGGTLEGELSPDEDALKYVTEHEEFSELGFTEKAKWVIRNPLRLKKGMEMRGQFKEELRQIEALKESNPTGEDAGNLGYGNLDKNTVVGQMNLAIRRNRIIEYVFVAPFSNINVPEVEAKENKNPREAAGEKKNKQLSKMFRILFDTYFPADPGADDDAIQERANKIQGFVTELESCTNIDLTIDPDTQGKKIKENHAKIREIISRALEFQANDTGKDAKRKRKNMEALMGRYKEKEEEVNREAFEYQPEKERISETNKRSEERNKNRKKAIKDSSFSSFLGLGEDDAEMKQKEYEIEKNYSQSDAKEYDDDLSEKLLESFLTGNHKDVKQRDLPTLHKTLSSKKAVKARKEERRDTSLQAEFLNNKEGTKANWFFRGVNKVFSLPGKLADKTKKLVKTAASKINKGLGEKMGDGSKTATQFLGDTIKGKIQDLYDEYLPAGAKKTAFALLKKLKPEKAIKAIKNTAESVKDKAIGIKDKAIEIKDKAKEIKDRVKRFLGFDDSQSQSGGVKQSGVLDKVSGVFSGMVDTVKNKGSAVIGDVQDKAKTLKEYAQPSLDNTDLDSITEPGRIKEARQEVLKRFRAWRQKAMAALAGNGGEQTVKFSYDSPKKEQLPPTGPNPTQQQTGTQPPSDPKMDEARKSERQETRNQAFGSLKGATASTAKILKKVSKQLKRIPGMQDDKTTPMYFKTISSGLMTLTKTIEVIDQFSQKEIKEALVQMGHLAGYILRTSGQAVKLKDTLANIQSLASNAELGPGDFLIAAGDFTMMIAEIGKGAFSLWDAHKATKQKEKIQEAMGPEYHDHKLYQALVKDAYALQLPENKTEDDAPEYIKKIWENAGEDEVLLAFFEYYRERLTGQTFTKIREENYGYSKASTAPDRKNIHEYNEYQKSKEYDKMIARHVRSAIKTLNKGAKDGAVPDEESPNPENVDIDNQKALMAEKIKKLQESQTKDQGEKSKKVGSYGMFRRTAQRNRMNAQSAFSRAFKHGMAGASRFSPVLKPLRYIGKGVDLVMRKVVFEKINKGTMEDELNRAFYLESGKDIVTNSKIGRALAITGGEARSVSLKALGYESGGVGEAYLDLLQRDKLTALGNEEYRKALGIGADTPDSKVTKKLGFLGDASKKREAQYESF